MKSKIGSSANVVFDPITIEVVIENKADLADLWHRLNVGSLAINEVSDEVRPDWRAGWATGQLWEQLDKLARGRGFVS